MSESEWNPERRRSGEPISVVPPLLRGAAALSWRLLVVLGGLYVLMLIVGKLSVAVIPASIALLFAALLAPAVDRLVRWRVPRGLATGVVLVGGIAVIGGVLAGVVNAFIEGFPQLQAQVTNSLSTIRDWLVSGPLHLRQEQLDSALQEVFSWLQRNQERLTSGAVSTASTVTSVFTGLLLMLFTLIFFLHDGRRIWRFLIGVVPAHSRDRVDIAGRRGFASLVGYVRATALVAVVDAIGIGVGLAIIGVPLAVPLAALVFLGGFVPIVGAVVSGLVAVLVALVAKGPLAALLVLLVVLAVQQIEGNILQPLLLGRAVQLHPLAVVLGISVGVVQAGIVGALLAVPMIAVLNSAVRSLTSGEETSGVNPHVPEHASPPRIARHATRTEPDRPAVESEGQSNGENRTSEDSSPDGGSESR